jgi:hypothetical protein
MNLTSRLDEPVEMPFWTLAVADRRGKWTAVSTFWDGTTAQIEYDMLVSMAVFRGMDGKVMLLRQEVPIP